MWLYERWLGWNHRRWVRRLRKRDERIFAESRGRKDLRLNIGSSDSHLPGWISLDIRVNEGCVRMDATQPWPFDDGSAEAVNSEHFIEHLTRDAARTYLREAHRVLKPGGVIRTTTPSLRGLAQLYLAGDGEVLELHRDHGYSALTHGQMLNNYFYMWGHQQIYDFETLSALLRDAGFERIEERPWNTSRHHQLDGIDRHDPGGLQATVLCVDAVKPELLDSVAPVRRSG